MKYIFLLVFFVLAVSVSAQADTQLTLSYQPIFDGHTLKLNESYPKESLQIDLFKCYISNIRLYQGEEQVYQEKESYHLLDAADSTSLKIALSIPEKLNYSTLEFDIGIDSLTNVSGAFGGALDPTTGMYWTWQSGYINFKLEGTSIQCPARNNEFQFHIGGYQRPFYALQTVRLTIKRSSHIPITIALDDLLKQIKLTEQYEIMSPNQQAMEFAVLLPSIFKVVYEK